MEEKGPTTKERLRSIVNDFDSFDSEMKIGTRVFLVIFACSSAVTDVRSKGEKKTNSG